MPKPPSSLKPGFGVTPALGPAAPSNLAYGLNVGTVVSVQNHWREYYNPLPALNMQRARALYDFSRRGLNAELQNVYREMEGLFPTLVGLIERRTSPLLEMEWNIKTIAEDKLPKGTTVAMAEDQAATLRDAYDNIDNLYDAIEWLELGAFRGYSHLEKCYTNPGSQDLSVDHLEPVEQWHWTRKSMYATWEYVAAATQTNSGVPIEYSQFLIREARRPLDRIALILWIRASLCEKDWDAFVEIYGIPHWIIIMPPSVPKEQETNYMSAARRIAEGGSGALPNGADAKAADSRHEGGVFRPRLDWIQEQLVLAGTGGLLSMLSMPTGIGQGATGAHDDAFKQIGAKEARRISEVFVDQFDTPILDTNFPGQKHLAYFELSSKEEVDPVKFIAGVGVLATAGYQVSPEQITAKTGYEVTLKAAPVPPSEPFDPSDPSDPTDPSDPQLDPETGLPVPDPVPSVVKNRNADPGPDTTLIKNALPQVAAAKQRDLGPLFNRIAGIAELDDPRLMENALRKLKADLNDPKSEIVQSAISNPRLGAALADAMTAGVLNGMAQGEAVHPIRNRAVLNGGPGSGPRPGDSLGKWVDKNGGGLSVKDNIQRGNKALDRSIHQKADVQKAMYRKGLGRVDFKYGTPGDKANDFAGGHGISHALAKHGEGATRQIPETLAKGKVSVHPQDAEKRVVEHQGHAVVLAKDKKQSSWVITSFHPKT